MVTVDDLGQLVRFYSNGWRTGKLLVIEKARKCLVAVISPPIAGHRKIRVPVEDCEVYPDVDKEKK